MKQTEGQKYQDSNRRCKELYEDMDYSSAQLKKHIKKGYHYDSMLKKYITGNILNLGDGSGVFSLYLRKNGFSNIDISDYTENQRRHINKLGFKFIKQDLNEFPYQLGSYQTISLLGVIQYLNNQERVVKELRKHLKNGGILLLSVVNSRIRSNTIHTKLDTLTDLYSFQHWERVLTRNGYQIIGVIYNSWLGLNWLQFLWRFTSKTEIFVCKKL